jgi:putative phosphoribosyl transferase
MQPRFRDRREAGRELATALERHRGADPIALGLARGGLILAREIADALECDLDVLVARKVGAPQHPEYGIGAVAPGGIQEVDERALERLGLTMDEFDRLAGIEESEVRRRLDAYRAGRPPLDIQGRTAIVVDDGLATGVTAKAACRYVRSLEPEAVVLAVPVGSREACDALGAIVDEVVCLTTPEPFNSVGQWYEQFAQVEDEEAIAALTPGERTK